MSTSAPKTQEQLMAEKRQALYRLFLPVLYIALGLWITSLIDIHFPDAWLSIVKMVWFLGWVPYVIARLTLYLDACDQSKPLDGEGCLSMRKLIRKDSSVAEFALQVNKLGRPLSYADLWWANGVLYEKQRVIEHQACLEINHLEAHS